MSSVYKQCLLYIFDEEIRCVEMQVSHVTTTNARELFTLNGNIEIIFRQTRQNYNLLRLVFRTFVIVNNKFSKYIFVG